MSRGNRDASKMSCAREHQHRVVNGRPTPLAPVGHTADKSRGPVAGVAARPHLRDSSRGSGSSARVTSYAGFTRLPYISLTSGARRRDSVLAMRRAARVPPSGRRLSAVEK